LIRHGPVFIYWIFRQGERFPAIVAKLGTTGTAQESLRREAGALERLKHAPESMGIPRLLHQEEGRGGYLLVQTGKRGSPLSDNVSVNDPALLSTQIRIADRWLEEFHRAVNSEGSLGRSLEPWISRCRIILAAPTAEEVVLLDVAQEALERLETRPSAPVHGDFWAGNVLAEGTRVAVIDWGRFHFGTPTEDIFHFLSTLSFHHSPRATNSARTLWENFFGTSRLTQVGGQVTHATISRHGLGADSIHHLFTLFLLGQSAYAGFVHHEPWRAFVAGWVRAGFPEPFVKCPFYGLLSEGELTISRIVPAQSTR